MAKIFTVLKGGEVESGAPLTIVNGGKFLTLGESGRGRTLSLIRWLGPTEITRQAPEACPSCGGEGRHFKGSFRIGEPAPGSGMSTYDPSLWEDRYHPCINCNGTGKNPRAGEDYEPLLVTSTGPQVWATLSEKGKLIEIEPSSPAEAGDKALVIIRDQSGYRGGWVLYGRAIGQPSPNSEGYAEKGTQKETTPIPVATGTCAQGDAGRMGGGNEYALLLSPGEGFLISRSGRLYGGEDWINFFWDGATLSKETRVEFNLRTAKKGIRV